MGGFPGATAAYRPGEWADLLVIAPLSANTLGKLAHGLADNLLTNTVLASTCPVLLAPAMNTDMWQQGAVQRNWQLLRQDLRYHAVGPGSGLLACDRIGTGRMAEPQDILAHVTSLLHSGGKRDLAGKHLLISTGSTREFLDPVRFIGNPASGKMGLPWPRRRSVVGPASPWCMALWMPIFRLGFRAFRLFQSPPPPRCTRPC